MSQKSILVLGGAASGKSAYAEKLIIQSGLDRNYIATSRIWDDEMAAKKDAHIAARGGGWTTHEAPLDVASIMMTLPPKQAVLIDCATMWLTNQVMDENDIDAATDSLLQGCARYTGTLVIVSNELGHGVVPADAMTRRFRNLHGQMNQRLAAMADTVVLITAGLPQILKGAV